MSSKSQHQRWAGSVTDSGILRKNNRGYEEERLQELLVFGYGCKLYRDDERAKNIDHGRHLIPWMGDTSLKIDRYDGRGALGDLSIYEPPPGGYDPRTCLTEEELKVEQLCDEERYRSLTTNDAEDALCHEEEMKRLQQALDHENNFRQVPFNYDEDSQKASCEDSQSPREAQNGEEEEEEKFVLPQELSDVPQGMVLPETEKLNAIITKTALFISRQGGQMEILIKAKQANNPQFAFLSMDGVLHPYYRHVLEAIKSGRYNPEKQTEEKQETEDDEESDPDDEPYLHPSLAPSFAKVEAAPSIPSIQYKPSEHCAYSMLVNKITGKPPQPKTNHEQETNSPIPPGPYYQYPAQPQYAQPPQQYSHGPVLYTGNGQVAGQTYPVPPAGAMVVNSSETGAREQQTRPPLVPYGPTPPKPLSRPSFIVPPADVQIIIDKMASYVAKNGRDFEAIVKNKGDPRFNFLELSHQYHGYYAHKLTIYEGAVNPKVLTEEELLRKQEPQVEKQKKLEELHKKQQRMEEVQKRVKMIQAKRKNEQVTEVTKLSQATTVSFSIAKKIKDDASIEKRSALPLEESDDDESEKRQEAFVEQGVEQRVIEPRVQDTDRPKKFEDNELVDLTTDLTDEILEDCQKEIRISRKLADDRLKDKLAAAAREKLASSSRDRQLQLERKRKAEMFLSQIQAKKKTEVQEVAAPVRDEEEEVVLIQSLPREETRKDDSPKGCSSLMSRLKGAEFNEKRGVRHRSRSRSRSRSDRHRIHKKHKKKHKSDYDSPSSSRSSHRSKRRKKRSRSRTPTSRRHDTARHHSRGNSSDSSSTTD